jgi:hypothetical protein
MQKIYPMSLQPMNFSMPLCFLEWIIEGKHAFEKLGYGGGVTLGQFSEIHYRPSNFKFNFNSHPLEELSSEDQFRLEGHQQHIRTFETSEKGWQRLYVGQIDEYERRHRR